MSPKPVQHQLGAQARKGSCHTAGRHQKGQVTVSYTHLDVYKRQRQHRQGGQL